MTNGARSTRSARVRRERDERIRSEEHTSELQSPCNLVCRLLLEKKNNTTVHSTRHAAFIEKPDETTSANCLALIAYAPRPVRNMFSAESCHVLSLALSVVFTPKV